MTPSELDNPLAAALRGALTTLEGLRQRGVLANDASIADYYPPGFSLEVARRALAGHVTRPESVVAHDGDTWRVLSKGATREDGFVYCHLASLTRSQPQRNGDNPIQCGDWIDPRMIAEVSEQHVLHDARQRAVSQRWSAQLMALPPESRVDAVVDAVLGEGEMSLGDALRLGFPEATSGDVAMDADFRATQALRVLVEQWVHANVPKAAATPGDSAPDADEPEGPRP